MILSYGAIIFVEDKFGMYIIKGLHCRTLFLLLLSKSLYYNED